jgi:membrane associated rhomboid family serine protease
MAVFRSIWDDIVHAFKSGSMVTRLIIINFLVFVLVNLAYFIVWLKLGGGEDPDLAYSTFRDGLQYFCMSSDWHALLKHLWTPITSIFLHESFLHFLGNTIALYLFGRIVGDLIGEIRVLPIYLLGGLAGNLLFFISAQFLFPVGTYALGASGAIMALAGASLVLAPDWRVMLFLLGEVKVKYIVLVMVLLDLVGIANQSNTGGHAAHIGGFLMGCLFVYRLRDGKDMSEPINRILNAFWGLFSRRRRLKPTAKRKTEPAMNVRFGGSKGQNTPTTDQMPFQERVDAILDKIKANGYESLNQEEKDFLFNASKK